MECFQPHVLIKVDLNVVSRVVHNAKWRNDAGLKPS